jgi:broad specificity phosphatase PhoE
MAATHGHKIVRFMRHGQAAHNVTAEPLRAAGCTYDAFLEAMAKDDAFDAPLTPLGISQAAEAAGSAECAAAMASVQLVVASPLSRAIDTADLCFPQDSLEMASRAVPRLVKEEAREIAGLLLNGKRRKRSELAALYPHWDCAVGLADEEDAHWEAVGGSQALEEEASCRRRGRELLAWVWARPETDVVVVAHGGLFHLLANGHSPTVEASEGVQARFTNCELRSCRLEAIATGEGGDGADKDAAAGAFRLTLLRE